MEYTNFKEYNNNKHIFNNYNLIYTNNIFFSDIVFNSCAGFNNIGLTFSMNSGIQIMIHCYLFISDILISFEINKINSNIITNEFINILKDLIKEIFHVKILLTLTVFIVIFIIIT